MDGRRDELGPLADQYLDREIKSLEQKGVCGIGVEMKWVHLRINTRVRMLGRLGCISLRLDLDHIALRPQKLGCLYRDGDREEEEGERVKARPRMPPEKDRRDRGPPPEQWKCLVKTSARRNCCFNRRAGQSHKDNVRCTAVEEQPEAKEVQLSQPSSISLLMISSD